MKKKRSGFSAIAVVLVLAVLGLVGFVGWYVWHTKDTVDKNSSESTTTQPAKTAKTNTDSSITPTEFINQLLPVIAEGNNAKLEAYLTPVDKQFREQNLTQQEAEMPHCKKYYNCNAGKSTRVLALISSSLLTDPASLEFVTPTITDYTFKDGQKGKSIVYKEVQTEGDAGTTFYIFNVVPSGNSWLLNDYTDFFSSVAAGQKLTSNAGLRELTAN